MRFRLLTNTFIARDQTGAPHSIDVWTEFINGDKFDPTLATEIGKYFRATIDGQCCPVTRLDKGCYRVDLSLRSAPLHLFAEVNSF